VLSLYAASLFRLAFGKTPPGARLTGAAQKRTSMRQSGETI